MREGNNLQEPDRLSLLAGESWIPVFGHVALLGVFIDGRVRGNRLPFALGLCALVASDPYLRSTYQLVAFVNFMIRMLDFG